MRLSLTCFGNVTGACGTSKMSGMSPPVKEICPAVVTETEIVNAAV
jgi:hypothetical protein